MTKATKDAKPSIAQQRAALGSLNQRVAAELIGKPAVWLRDNAHIAKQNADDTYDGPSLVAAVLEHCQSGSDSTKCEPTNDEAEAVMQVVETVCVQDWAVALRALEHMHTTYGEAGLAEIGRFLIEAVQYALRVEPRLPTELPSEEEFVERHVREPREQAREEYKRLSNNWESIRAGRLVYKCRNCGKFRFGRQWLPRIPKGYAEQLLEITCPKCRG